MNNLQYLGDKQPWEEYYLGIDFTKDLGAASISSAVVSVIDLADDSDVTATIIDGGAQQESGSIVYFWVRGGAHGDHFKINCKVTGTDGSKYEADHYLNVVEL